MARLKITLIVAVALGIAVLIFVWDQKSSIPHSHSVTLTWNPSAGADFYFIYRSPVSGSGYQKIGSSPANSYRDSVVPGNSVFYYVVTAVNEHGESHYSREIKVFIPK